jgi:hypothetical protein
MAIANLVFAQDATLLLSHKTVDKNDSPLDSVVYNYDEQNRLIEEVRDYFSNSSETWVKSSRKEYSYEGSKLKTLTFLNHDGTKFDKHWLHTYFYNSEDALDSMTTQKWVDGSWLPFERKSYLNNEKNNPIEITYDKMNESGSYLPYEKIEVSYDFKDREILRLTKRWNATKKEYESKTEWITDYWNGKIEKESRRELYVLDWYYVDYFYYEYTSFGEIKTRTRFISSDNSINDVKHYRYNKEDQTNSAPSNLEVVERVNTYPNPFSTSVVFDFGEGVYDLEITNLEGKTVKMLENLKGNVSVERGTMPAGVYFYKASNQIGKTQNGKLIAE